MDPVSFSSNLTDANSISEGKWVDHSFADKQEQLVIWMPSFNAYEQGLGRHKNYHASADHAGIFKRRLLALQQAIICVGCDNAGQML